MANFFKVSTNKNSSKVSLIAQVTRLDDNGCGVANLQNKPLFIQGALPNETVEVKVFEQKNKYARAKLINIKQASVDRVKPKCLHFGVCGGCDLQMLAVEQQLPFKQQKVMAIFSRYFPEMHQDTKLLPWQASITSSPWHYRRKARLGVQFNKKAEAVIGFRQKATNQLVAIKSCPVLVEPLSDIFPILKNILAKLTVKAAIGHIEVIYADIDNADDRITLVVRQLKPINKQDVILWSTSAIQQYWQVIIDDGESQKNISSHQFIVPPITKTDSHSHENNGAHSLSYRLPQSITAYQDNQGKVRPIKLNFAHHDFIQVNHHVNLAMIEQALLWLQIEPSDNMLDLFCGLGNFSLAMATLADKVTGVEGVQAMTDQANRNAQGNGINNCQFYHSNLNEPWLEQSWAKQNFDKVLLDPARAGAEQAVQQIAQLKIPIILYVSCDPSTLARDSQLLMSCGYQLEKISLIDMFSQTKHIETMALFRLKTI